MVLAAFAGGAAVGWTAASEQQARREVQGPEVIEVQVPSYGSATDAVMPDVRGLAREAALEVIADSGITVDAVTTEERASAGTPGIVIEQTPVFGSAAPDTITLVISTPAVVPGVEGRTGTEVVAELAILGAEVETVPVYVAGVAAGKAVSISPATGEPLPDRVTLEVAEPSSSIFLSSLRSVEGSCGTGARTVNGVKYPEALNCRADDDGADVAWAVSRVVDAVQGVVGISDDDDPTDRVRVEVLADGVSVAMVEAGYGAPATLEASVTGALRVTIRSTYIGTGTRSSGAAILGDVRLVGGAAQIAQLETDQ